MFSGLRENAPIYILTKGERPVLQVGTVARVSNPSGGFPQGIPGYNQNQTMEVTVKVGDSTFDLKALPCGQTTHLYAKENAYVTDNWQEMLTEIDNLERSSQAIVDSAPLHAGLVKSYKGMKEQLDPQIAKERAREERMDAMEGRIGGMEGDIKRVISLLESLNGSGGKKSSKE